MNINEGVFVKSIKKIIAAVAVAAVIVTVSTTTAFAIPIAEDSVDSVNYTLDGVYMDLSYGFGFATTINTTPKLRLANAVVEVCDASGTPIPDARAYNNDKISTGETVTANVKSEYKVKGYTYTCSGSIYGDATHYSPVMETLSGIYLYCINYKT